MIDRRAVPQELRALLLALGLLTRIPMPSMDTADPALPGRSLHWYPAAGLVIGLVLAVLAGALCWAAPNAPLLAAALLVCLWVALTGALHLDGLADCADAWVGGMGDRERTLAIMKDPSCGPMGVAAITLVLLLKTVALATLLGLPGQWAWWLIPLAARALLPLAFVGLPYCRAGGMGDGLAAGASRRGIALALGLTALLCILTLPWTLAALWLLVAAAIFVLWRRAMLLRLGGFTGDGAGALVELAELALLVASALYLAGGAT